MKIVGLTGGIACGKSTVAALLRGKGVPVVDADAVSREIVEPGEPALAEIAGRFGPGVIAEGRLDRAALGRLVMGDAPEVREARRALEAITHPRISARILEKLAALAGEGHAVGVVESALMVEMGTWRSYDALLVAYCSPEVQVRRLMERQGFAEEEARRWIASQMPAGEKAALATAVVDNSGPAEALEGEVERAWGAVLEKLGLVDGRGATAG